MITTKIKQKAREAETTQDSKSRRIDIWRSVAGIWKGRGGPDPVAYQRAIRRDRKLS